MVKVRLLDGLRPGPPVARVFAAESKQCPRLLQRGDEVRCTDGHREIYVRILGVAADGCLLGNVAAFGDPGGSASFDVRIGDLVQFPSDRVLAVLQPA